MMILQKVENGLWTLGSYDPRDNEWNPIKDFDDLDEGILECSRMNGSNSEDVLNFGVTLSYISDTLRDIKGMLEKALKES